jgi:hypothetical protein
LKKKKYLSLGEVVGVWYGIVLYTYSFTCANFYTTQYIIRHIFYLYGTVWYSHFPCYVLYPNSGHAS